MQNLKANRISHLYFLNIECPPFSPQSYETMAMSELDGEVEAYICQFFSLTKHRAKNCKQQMN